MAEDVALGIALLVLMGAMPLVLIELLVNAGKLTFWASDRLREMHARRHPQPPGRPVQKIAADLRRLSTLARDPAPISAARRLGVQRAYDDTLAEACRALGLEQRLAELDGLDRDLERLRLEGALEASGLVLRGPHPRHPHEQT